jgi:quercetin dioxygenase-like cupin family protein
LKSSSRASEILGKIFRLKELTGYQPGAIVSRTLVDEDAGTVTAFAFDEGQGLSEHTAPYDVMIIALEGEVDIRISAENFHLGEGEMIILPANRPHALKATKKFKMILIMIRAS